MLKKEVMFYRLKSKDAFDHLKEWGKRLRSELNQEACETLKEENCISETLYLLNSDEGHFGMFVGVFDGEKKPPNMDKEINKKHMKFFDDALLNIVEPFPIFTAIECVYHLERN